MDHHPKILKANGLNYSSWSYIMRNSILGRELWDLVNGSVTKPDPKHQNYSKLLNNWEASNAKILDLINGSVDPSIRKRLAIFKSAKEAWDYLKRLYGNLDDQSTLAEKYQLEVEMRAILQDDRSIQELYLVMIDFWDKLAMMEPNDLSNLDNFIKYREEYRLVQFLLPLNDEFDSLRWSILGRSILPSVTEAVTELIAEENRLKWGISSHRDTTHRAETYWFEIEIRAIKQCHRSIQGLFNVLSGFWDRLANLEPNDLSNLDSFKKYREEHCLVQLLIALRDDFDPFRRSILQRSTSPSLTEIVAELIAEERRLKSSILSPKHRKSVTLPHSKLASLSLNSKADHQVRRDECLYCHQTGHWKANCPARLKNDQTTSLEPIQQSGGHQQPSSSKARPTSFLTPNTDQPVLSDDLHRLMVKLCAQVESDYFGNSPLESGCYLPPSPRSGGYQPTQPNPMQQSGKYYQPSSSKSRSASSLITDTDVNSMVQVESNYFGGSQFDSASYFPKSNEEDSDWGMVSSSLKILSYNVWFREDVEIDKRMEALGDLIQLHSPDVICFQEVTLNIYNIFKKSNWWKIYNCSISDQKAGARPYFCMQLSKLPVNSFSCKPFGNTRMGRELCMLEIEVQKGKPLIIATSHLESPSPAPPNWDQMYSNERVAQAKEALDHLKKSPNVIFCGDMNWDDDLDGDFPLIDGWVDPWVKLRPGENGWTYDTKSNPMLSGNRPLQKRLDRFICHLPDFRLSAIDMIGMEAIPGLSYFKEKRVRNRMKELVLPVLPSDHYGLLLQVYSQ